MSSRRRRHDEESSEEEDGSEYESGSGSEETRSGSEDEYETESEDEDEVQSVPVRNANNRSKNSEEDHMRSKGKENRSRQKDNSDDERRGNKSRSPHLKEKAKASSADDVYSSRKENRASFSSAGNLDRAPRSDKKDGGDSIPSPMQGKIDMPRAVAVPVPESDIRAAVHSDDVPSGRRRSSFAAVFQPNDPSAHVTLQHVPRIDAHSYCNVVHIVDFDHVICGCGDSTVRLYMLSTGQIVTFYEGLSDRVLAASSFLMMAPTISVSEYESRKKNKTSHWADEVAAPMREQMIVAGSRDETICAWHMKSAELEWQVVAHDGAVWGLTCTSYYDYESRNAAGVPVVEVVISAGADGLVKVWDMKDGSALKVYRGHGGRVNTLALLQCPSEPYTYQIASGGVDRKIHVWNIQTAQASVILPGHTDEVLSVAVVKTANSSHYDIVKLQPSKMKQNPNILTVAPAGTHDSENMVIVSGGRDMSVFVWDYKYKKALFIFKGHVNAVTGVSGFVCRSRQLIIVSSCDDGTIKLWSMSHASCVRSKKLHSRSVRGLSVLHLKLTGEKAHSPIYNSTLICSGGWDKCIFPVHETVPEYGIVEKLCTIM